MTLSSRTTSTSWYVVAQVQKQLDSALGGAEHVVLLLMVGANRTFIHLIEQAYPMLDDDTNPKHAD